ncbi:class I adenylate-forming enzyme family protein [Aliikangiella maris]|uniref:Class I adenylate-forming enzyme family protein n=2 Tax=Aliikangiella maris TaxID=3162458 RepID=A0ABV3MJH3_9GAMM
MNHSENSSNLLSRQLSDRLTNRQIPVEVKWPLSAVPAEQLFLVETQSDKTLQYAQILLLIQQFNALFSKKLQLQSKLGQLLSKTFVQDAEQSIPQHKCVISVLVKDRFELAIITLLGLFSPVIVNSINPELRADEIETLLTHAEPTLIISDDDIEFNYSSSIMRLSASEIFEQIKQVEIASDVVKKSVKIKGDLLIYTSGTTGQPKGVHLLAANILHNVHTACKHLPFFEGICTMSILPLFHTFTVISDLLTAFYCGGRCIINPVFNMQTIKVIADSTHQWQVNSFSAVPVIFETLSLLKADLADDIQFVVSGAAPLTEAVRSHYQQQFKHYLIPCYGMSEAVCFITITPYQQILPGSPGKPAGLNLQILDDQQKPVAINQRGEIAIKGGSVIRQYFKANSEQQKLFTDDGWLLTGDIGYLNEQGYLTITGRKKNMVIRGGEKVYLEDVERCLMKDKLVRDVSSFCITDKRGIDKAVIFAVAQSEQITLEILKSTIKSSLGNHHIPEHIVFVDEIPRTPTGKPYRKRMNEILVEQNLL